MLKFEILNGITYVQRKRLFKKLSTSNNEFLCHRREKKTMVQRKYLSNFARYIELIIYACIYHLEIVHYSEQNKAIINYI